MGKMTCTAEARARCPFGSFCEEDAVVMDDSECAYFIINAENEAAKGWDPFLQPLKTVQSTIEIIDPRPTRLIGYHELQGFGHGWVEEWVEDDEGPAHIEVLPCAWLRFNILERKDSVRWNAPETGYNRRKGYRVWAGDKRPTDEQREAEEWRKM